MNMLALLDEMLLKNRTIVSRDSAWCVDRIGQTVPLTVHRYPTGREYQTWPIPPEWNVNSARVSDANGIIASYEDTPLFLAPYSSPFSGWVNREELLQHVFTNPEKPDAFCYEHRIAYDYRRRLKEWRISLPYERVRVLPDGPFHVEIDIETRPGHMIVAEVAHPGASGSWFTFLAHYCHVAQANDGIAGVVVMSEVMERIRRRFPTPRHGYRALLMPETIGSSVYAATHEEELDNTLGAVFSEMPGAESPLQLLSSRRGDTYIDRVFQHVLRSAGKWPVRSVPLRKGWGNDELVFDSPGFAVPALSLDRYPFAAYHTHHDDLSLVKADRLEEVVELLLAVVGTLERDYIPRPRNRVPVYLTRFDIYADWTNQRQDYDNNVLLMESLWSGLSVLDVALKHDLDLALVESVLDVLKKNELIDATDVTPHYTRNVRFLPKVEA